MRILRKKSIDYQKKSFGAESWYYPLGEHELIISTLDSGCATDWHKHEQVSESVMIIDGELVAEVEQEGEVVQERLGEGDLIEFGHDFHHVINESDQSVKFVTLKVVPTGVDNKAVFAKDKISKEL